MHSANIASHLSTIANLQANTLAIADQKSGRQYTYRQLDNTSDIFAKGLMSLGISKGVRTVLMVTPNIDFFVLVFGLFKVGAVMVAVDPGIGTKQLGKCLSEAEPEAFIGIKKAHIARRIFGWAKKTIKTNIIVDSSFIPKSVYGRNILSLEELKQSGTNNKNPVSVNTQEEDTAAILFTSGSTGIPKGVIYTHSNFNAQISALKNLYNIQAGEIDLSTFPLFALFGPAMGTTSIIPDMDFTRPGSVNPKKIFSAIEKYKVTTMFGSPALLNCVGLYGKQQQKKLPKIKRVLSAGAEVPSKVMQCFSEMLSDDVQIFTPYGATEALPISSIGSNEVLQSTCHKTKIGKGVCVGLPLENIDLKIISITDDVISSWQDALILDHYIIGEIVVKGLQVTKAYYARQHATELSKIIDPAGGFYHRMGDLAYLDKQGYLWFCGRLSQRVITNEKTLFTTPCEGIFNAHKKIFRTALVSVNNNDQVIPIICVELQQADKKSDKKIIATELLKLGAQFEQTKTIQHILFHPDFPVDIRHNAKIGREKLAIWAKQEITKKGLI